MKTLLALALAVSLTSGAAFAQQPDNVFTRPGGVSTAPTVRAPNGITINQGAGVPGMSAVPAAPHPTTPHPHGPDNPQAGVPGAQDPSQLGGSAG